MMLIDANLLLYAYDSATEHHSRSKEWLESVLSSPEPVRLPWVTILAFLRIATAARILQSPLLISEAISIVSGWLAQPSVEVLEPGERHLQIMSSLLPAAQVRGPLVTDGHLAALAIEHGATLYTTDKDFARFPGLRIVNPLN